MKGLVTSILGAAVAVDPVTATLPLLPDNVHSAAASLPGAAVGQAPPAAGVTGADVTSADVPAEEVDELSGLGVQALRPRTRDAAQATKATGDDMREEFTPSRYIRLRLYPGWHPGCRLGHRYGGSRLAAGFGELDHGPTDESDLSDGVALHCGHFKGPAIQRDSVSRFGGDPGQDH